MSLLLYLTLQLYEKTRALIDKAEIAFLLRSPCSRSRESTRVFCLVGEINRDA